MNTSIEAKDSMTECAATMRARVLTLLRGFPTSGATDEQIQHCLSMNPSTERPRRIELVRMGLVRDSGRTRETSSGRKAIVWTVLPTL